MIDFNRIKEFYMQSEVRFEIVKQTFQRETAFIAPHWTCKSRNTTRMLKIHNVYHLETIMRALNMFTEEIVFNIYHSVARYMNGIPDQTLNLKERESSTWNDEHHRHITGYDFFLDIDSGNDDITVAYRGAEKIKKLFDDLSVPYQLIFSGRGFHFVIPYNKMPMTLSYKPDEIFNVYDYYKKIASYLKMNISHKIDTQVYDSRRVRKVPYSLAVYQDKMFMCCPILSDAAFNKFDIEDYLPELWYGNIRDRGLHTFNDKGNVSRLISKANMW